VEPPPIIAAADALIRAGRRLGARGLISAGEGNLSVRLDRDRLLVTPAGLRKDELDPGDLVVVWIGHPIVRFGLRPVWNRRRISPSTSRSTGHGPTCRPSSMPTCRRRWP
jgi:hypothetical protein